VQHDVRYGLVSREKAERDYGVVLRNGHETAYAATTASEMGRGQGHTQGENGSGLENQPERMLITVVVDRYTMWCVFW
jgi:hypothetical protein